MNLDPRTRPPTKYQVEYYTETAGWVRGAEGNLWEVQSSRKFFTAPTRLVAVYEVRIVIKNEVADTLTMSAKARV